MKTIRISNTLSIYGYDFFKGGIDFSISLGMSDSNYQICKYCKTHTVNIYKSKASNIGLDGDKLKTRCNTCKKPIYNVIVLYNKNNKTMVLQVMEET